MSRFLLALCLSAFASTAMANGNASAGDPADASLKANKSTAVNGAQDADAAPAGQAAAAPARATPRTAAPRWHSLLPGMIR